MKFTAHLFFSLFILSIFPNTPYAQDRASKNAFADIALINKITFIESKYDQPRFSCGFLIKYQSDTFAVTAKHLLRIIKSEKMKVVTLENYINNWLLHPLEKENEQVITDRLLNENKSESLDKNDTYKEDWLLFSIKANSSNVKPLELRTMPLLPREKLYVIGWPRKIEAGNQRVYEFEYYKSIGNRLLLKV